MKSRTVKQMRDERNKTGKKRTVKELTTCCPECGCDLYYNENLLGEGYRVCRNCSQEWWTDIDYTKKEAKNNETTH
jgi:acetyl-CoA carboxylase beta subunit